MQIKPVNLSLSAEQLAQLFLQLNRLEIAGFPAFEAFALLEKTESRLKKPLNYLQKQLKAGKPISEAGYNAGIFNSTHRSLIHAAENSGRLAEVYRQLADHYTGLSSRIKKVKSRLYFPALSLIIALFIQPLPAFITAEISLFDYLSLSLGKLFIIVFLVFIVLKLPGIFKSLGLESLIHSLLLRISITANWIIKRQLNEFFFILTMMLEAGLAFSEALPKAVASIKNTTLRKRFAPALVTIKTGASVAETLAKVADIKPMTIHVIDTGERAGKLASSLMHFTKIEAENISLQDDALAEWLPRIIYSLIAIWMGYSIIGAKFATVIPNDL